MYTFNNSESLSQEFIITYIFYSACGLRSTSRISDIRNNKILKVTVPSASELIINGKPAIYGEQLAKETNNLIQYYYKEFQNESAKGNIDENINEESKKSFKLEYAIRNETWNGKLFKDTLESIADKFEQMGVSKEVVMGMFEYIGENGIRFNI